VDDPLEDVVLEDAALEDAALDHVVLEDIAVGHTVAASTLVLVGPLFSYCGRTSTLISAFQPLQSCSGSRRSAVGIARPGRSKRRRHDTWQHMQGAQAPWNCSTSLHSEIYMRGNEKQAEGAKGLVEQQTVDWVRSDGWHCRFVRRCHGSVPETHSYFQDQ
jgi:hypothetical protein